MRRDIQKEQALAVGVVGKNVVYLKSEIDLLSEKESKRNGKYKYCELFLTIISFLPK